MNTVKQPPGLPVPHGNMGAPPEGMRAHPLMQSLRPVLINKSESGWF